MSHRRLAVEFVCLGNICRSPLGEGIFRHRVALAGLSERFEIASAGTGGWHVGEPPDPRSVAVARRHGIDISAQRGRQLVAGHLDHYDEILAMDTSNLRGIRRFERAGQRARLGLLLAETPEVGETDVPDPYSGVDRDFETVFTLVDGACAALLDRLRAKL
jgi:protein-tyrosine phosphatase